MQVHVCSGANQNAWLVLSHYPLMHLKTILWHTINSECTFLYCLCSFLLPCISWYYVRNARETLNDETKMVRLEAEMRPKSFAKWSGPKQNETSRAQPCVRWINIEINSVTLHSMRRNVQTKCASPYSTR